MHADRSLRIDLRAVAAQSEPLQLKADEAFFKSQSDPEILDGEVEVAVGVSGPRAGVYRIAYHVMGIVNTPCDRCNEPVAFKVDADDERFVTSYDSDAEPTDEAPLAERGDKYDLGHDVFETVALVRPLGYSHEEGGCDPAAESFISGSAD